MVPRSLDNGASWESRMSMLQIVDWPWRYAGSFIFCSRTIWFGHNLCWMDVAFFSPIDSFTKLTCYKCWCTSVVINTCIRKCSLPQLVVISGVVFTAAMLDSVPFSCCFIDIVMLRKHYPYYEVLQRNIQLQYSECTSHVGNINPKRQRTSK